MFERIKTTLAVFLILLLFPYVTVMLTGHNADAKALEGQSVFAAWEQTELDPVEQWVMEILPSQMPVTYEPEALKAQAIIVRSNLRFLMEQEALESSQLNREWLEKWGMDPYTLLELRELWGKERYPAYYEKIHQAVEDTCGKILVYQGSCVDIPYHAVSAGNTRDGALLEEEYFYLKAVECPGEQEAKNFVTVTELKKEELRSAGQDKNPSGLLEVLSRDSSGYVTEIRMGEKRMAGEEFRRMFNLPSSCFHLQEQKDQYVVTTKGLGHGFGLSMYQAQLLATRGMNCNEILQYFYEDLECISSP